MGATYSIERLKHIANATQALDDAASRVVGHVSIDSRECRPKSLFVALRGKRHRAVRFAEDAYKKGCRHFLVNKSDRSHFPKTLLDKSISLLLVRNTEHAYQALARAYMQSLPGVRVAITGSAGKTFVKELLAHICKEQFKVFASEANENNHIGVPKNVLRIGSQHDLYLFECAMNRPGEIRRLSWILEPDITLITNVLPAHIGYLKSIEAIAKAKFEIFSHQKRTGMAVLNEQLKGLLPLSEHKPPDGIAFFEPQKHLSVSGSFNSLATGGCALSDAKTSSTISVPVMPNFLLGNVEAALVVANKLGVRREVALRQLQNFPLPSRRFEVVQKKNPIVIDDAYNANPVATYESVASLLSLAKADRGEVVVCLVLGDMFELGSKARGYHKKLARQLQALFEEVGGVGDIHLYFVGKHMKIAYKTLRWPNKTYFRRNEPDLIVGALPKTMESRSVVFLKASNGMHFNRVVKRLLCSTT